MRFALAVMAVFLSVSVSGMAQSQPNPYKVKTSKVEAEPKSTANVKVPTGHGSFGDYKRTAKRGAGESDEGACDATCRQETDEGSDVSRSKTTATLR